MLIVIEFLLAGSCASPRTASTAARVDSLFKTWNRQDSPGCGVGVSRNGAVIYEHGYGMASLERKAPITTSTVFPLASITKPFTAMSVLLAAERGLLSLDDDVSTYIPDWSIREHRVTIRHLLTHTSGLRDAYVLQGWTPHAGNSNDVMLKILSRQRGLNSAPGTRYQYNNGGYLLLGRILERASGQTLGAFADANIFRPLGMKDAYFNGDPVRTAPDHASGYSPQPSGWRLVPESPGYAGNGGMMSSVRDLLLWANNFADARVGTPALLAHMHTATVLTSGQTTPSGMGLPTGSYRGTRTFHMSGGDFGTTTHLDFYPDQKVAIAVLCNMDSVVMGGLATVNAEDLAKSVADIFLEDVFQPRAAPAASTPPSPTSLSLSAEELASKTGFYRVGSDEDHIVFMSVREGKLTLRDFYGDNYDLLMIPISPNRFLIPGSTLEFSPAEAGRPQAWYVIDDGGQRLVELGLMKFDIPKADLESFTGEYRSDELDVTYTVTVRDSSLLVQSSTLYPVFKDGFVGVYVGTVRFLRDPRGAVTGFTVNRNSARGVRFERIKRESNG
jgi:CubicO group peptidase (beta-lactamase class C family)